MKINSLCSPKEFPLKDVTRKIIACAIEVHSRLGPGCWKVFTKKLAYEFELSVIKVERQDEIELKRLDKKISFIARFVQIRGHRGE